jgi:hypothetical protein
MATVVAAVGGGSSAGGQSDGQRGNRNTCRDERCAGDFHSYSIS